MNESSKRELGFRTRAIHVGNHRDPETGAIVPPIHVASTFVQPGAGDWGEFDYSRSGNPTRSRLEETLASLENGNHALAFSTGMSATHAVTMLLNSGDHIVAGSDIYGGTYRLLHKIVNRSDIDVTLVDTQDQQLVAEAIQKNTKLLWLESPGNPLMSITDLVAIAELGHQHGLLVAVDNTFASPVLTRPLDLGVDIVMHSATKYLGGHSDLLGGALVVNDRDLRDRLYFIQNATGAVLGPFESFLLSRGLKTVDIRVREQCRTAMMLAEFLSSRSDVRRVLYPGIASHPGHDLAKQQMNGLFGAMLSFEVEGGFERAKKIAESTEIFQLTVSLGAVESLIEQPASMSHASYDRADRIAHGINDDLVRLSVGLESPEDLQADLTRAISSN